jgi:dipeptide/tripeptide permease
VASFVGDQFDPSNKHLAKRVFDAFYWIINLGSFFACLLMPLFLRHFGAAVAFGIPGGLRLTETVVFWLRRKQYVMVRPGPPDQVRSYHRVGAFTRKCMTIAAMAALIKSANSSRAAVCARVAATRGILAGSAVARIAGPAIRFGWEISGRGVVHAAHEPGIGKDIGDVKGRPVNR